MDNEMDEKMKGLSMDIEAADRDKLRMVFPQCFTDGKLDIDLLLNLCGEYITDDFEKYEFRWKGKGEALQLAAKRSTGTLRPCSNESVNWDKTRNIYIEGDNLEVLKLLQTSYYRKVKMIYIDPPYNTGNDFVYEDDFKDPLARYMEVTKQTTKSNPESMGRFHTSWLNMMYSRLRLAANLLRDDGVIFISIDDNEVHNLRKLCDEIFGEENFLACVVWQKKYAATNDSKGFSTTHDYIVVYQKSQDFNRNLLPRTAEQNKPYKNDDGEGKGLWRSDNLLVKSFSESGVYPIINPNTGEEFLPPKGSCWRASKDTMQVWLSENRVFFGKDGKGAPQLKRYLNEVQQGRVPITWWAFEEVGHNDEANKEVKALFESKAPFDTPKPVRLLKQMLQIGTDKDSLVMDFFSGSATLAHAVMQLNSEDNGNRRFILVQLNELCQPDSEGAKAGYKNICEIGKERIRRAGAKLTETDGQATLEEKPPLDIGFRVFKLDSSNLKRWDSSPITDLEHDEEILLDRLLNHLDILKADRSAEDVTFEVMLKLGQDLCETIIPLDINGKTVYGVGKDETDGTPTFIVCLAEHITVEDAEAMADCAPGRIVFADRCFTNTEEKANVRLTLRDKGITIKTL